MSSQSSASVNQSGGYTSFWAASSNINSEEAGLVHKIISFVTAFFMDLYCRCTYGEDYSVKIERGEISVLTGGKEIRVNRFYYPLSSSSSSPALTAAASAAVSHVRTPLSPRSPSPAPAAQSSSAFAAPASSCAALADLSLTAAASAAVSHVRAPLSPRSPSPAPAAQSSSAFAAPASSSPAVAPQPLVGSAAALSAALFENGEADKEDPDETTDDVAAAPPAMAPAAQQFAGDEEEEEEGARPRALAAAPPYAQPAPSAAVAAAPADDVEGMAKFFSQSLSQFNLRPDFIRFLAQEMAKSKWNIKMRPAYACSDASLKVGDPFPHLSRVQRSDQMRLLSDALAKAYQAYRDAVEGAAPPAFSAVIAPPPQNGLIPHLVGALAQFSLPDGFVNFLAGRMEYQTRRTANLKMGHLKLYALYALYGYTDTCQETQINPYAHLSDDVREAQEGIVRKALVDAYLTWLAAQPQ